MWIEPKIKLFFSHRTSAVWRKPAWLATLFKMQPPPKYSGVRFCQSSLSLTATTTVAHRHTHHLTAVKISLLLLHTVLARKADTVFLSIKVNLFVQFTKFNQLFYSISTQIHLLRESDQSKRCINRFHM